MNKLALAGAAVILCLASALSAIDGAAPSTLGDDDPFDQSRVPLEVQPSDPTLAKIVLVAGRQSHGPGEHEFFAGCALLMKLLQQTPGVFPVIARDGWPKNPKTLENVKTAVFFMDGGSGHPIIHPKHMQVVQKLVDDGVGFVNLHYAVEYPKRYQDAVYN
jgi:hypothetical protein